MRKAVFIFIIIILFQNSFPQSKNRNIEITFLSNCGFLIESEGKKLLIDIEDPSKSFYKSSLNSVYQSMMRGKIPFNNISTILISHHHSDHFGVKELGQYLKTHPKVNLYTTMETKEEVIKNDSLMFNNISNNIKIMNIFNGKSENDIQLDGFKIKFLGTYHAGAPAFICPDLCFIIETSGKTIFYMSDIDPGYEKNYNIIQKALKSYSKIDLLFAPDAALYLNDWSSKEGINLIKNNINASQIVVMHFNPLQIKKSELKVRTNFSKTVFPKNALEKFILK